MTPRDTFRFCALPRRFVLASAAALALWMPQANAADKLPVIASFSILGDLVRVVGGDRVEVSTLVGPDEDAHVFEPKPTHAKAITQARLVVTNGLGFDPWATMLLKSANYKGLGVTAAQGVQPRSISGEHGYSGTDPHAWQNPNNVMTYVRNIATGLSKADPAGEAVFHANAQAYVQELHMLDTWAKAQFAAIAPARRKVITSHDAFGYFAAHYGIHFLAPQGISTETEPSARQVAKLIRQIQREKIRAVFVENMGNPKLIAQLGKDTGIQLGKSLYADALSAASGPAATYLQMMRHNITQLAQGMARNQE